jgi:site-specific DNA recombinase
LLNACAEVVSKNIEQEAYCRGVLEAVLAGRDEKCRSRYIPADQLDQLVWQDVCHVLQHPRVIEQALQRALGGAWLPQAMQARKEQLRKTKASLKAQLERLTEAYLAGILPLAEYKRRRHEVEQRMEAVDHQARQFEVQVQQHLELTDLAHSSTEFCQRISRGLEQATFEQKRQLVELLIDRVVVTNEEVEIRYVMETWIKYHKESNHCPLLCAFFSLLRQRWEKRSIVSSRQE